MTPQEKARAWSEIEKMIEKVVDPVLRKSMLSDLAMRARAEWGYCPSEKEIPDPELALEEWEQKFLDELAVAQAYGVVPWDDSVHRDNYFWMMKFVRSGGDLGDIPDDVRSEYVDKLYFDCLLKYGWEIEQQMEHLIK